MRRASFVIAIALSVASFVRAQEPAGAPESTHEAEQGDPMIWWKWANFALLAAGMGYLIAKNVPGLFRRRAEEIQQAIQDATTAKQAAEASVAAMEKRLAGIKTEIESLRAAARAEMQADGERVRGETERHLQRVQSQSSQEIILMARVARDELRRHSAELAIGLAEQRIRARVSADSQNRLVDGFLQDLRRVTPGVGA
jgi:F-type H+-transporting ATPase subunit b